MDIIQNKLLDTSSLKLYLSFTLPIIVILIILLYRNLFSTVNNSVISNPIPTVQISNISPCGKLKAKEQYHISDYIIAASYMTPCIQNSVYGYLSLDMIGKVIQSGARVIQIPICQASSNPDSPAIVATCEPDTMLITSLNSLELKDVWQIIINNAFLNKITNESINNPIFVELVINTNSPITLDTIAEAIYEKMDPKKITNKKIKLITPSDYDEGKFIFLEKLCRLQNKIILFTTSSIYNSEKLSKYVFHIKSTSTKSLFRKVKHSQLGNINYENGRLSSIENNNYSSKLSNIEQRKTDEYFRKQYIPQLEELILAKSVDTTTNSQDIEDIAFDILNDNRIHNKTIAYNKIGITCVEPIDIGSNYDFSEAVGSGCQIIYMNWQNNDSFLKSYIKMFEDNNSFLLKPDSMRLQLRPEISQDIASIYPVVEKLPIPLISNFPQFNYNLVVISYYNNPKLVLTNINGVLAIANRLSPINMNQLFIPIPSDLPSNNGSIHIASPINLNKVITVNAGEIMWSSLGLQKKTLEDQSWYPIQPLVPSDLDGSGSNNNARGIADLVFSIQAFEKKMKKCWFYQNGKIQLTNADTGNKDILNKMIFQLEIIPSAVSVSFMSQMDDIIVVTSVGAVGIVNKKNGVNTDFIIENINTSQSLKKFVNIPIRLKIRSSGKYLTQDETNIPVVNNSIQNDDNIFILQKDISNNNLVKIVNKDGLILSIIGKNGLQFIKPDRNTSNTRTTFKFETKYIIL